MAGVENAENVDGCIEIACMSETTHAFPDTQKLLNNPNFWIADTAASIHMTPHQVGMEKIKTVKQVVSLGDKSAMTATAVGEISGRFYDKHGNLAGMARLTDVALISTGYNLFSCTKMQKKGWILGGDQNSIWLTKGDQKIAFDIKITTPNGMIFAMFLWREIGAAGIKAEAMTMDYKVAHAKLGHLGEDATKAVAKHLGWTVTGETKKCESCEVAKAKQKSVPKESASEALKPGERRVHLDIAPLKPRPAPEGKPASVIGKPNTRFLFKVLTCEHSLLLNCF